MKKLSSLFLMMALVGFSFAQPCTKLFISEYFESYGNNKSIEIYNPTFGPKNLSGYKLLLFVNGGTSVSTFNLSGTIPAKGTYVVSNTSATAVIKALSDTVSGVIAFNGNDPVALVYGSDTLDIFGKIGVSTNILVNGVDSAYNKTFVRNASVQEGTKDWSVGINQWTTYAFNDSSYLRKHTMSSCAAPADTIAGFGAAALTTTESAGVYNLNVYLNQPVGAAKSATVTLTGFGNGGAATDVNSFTTQTVNFTAGSVSAVVPVTITDDLLKEGTETFTFTLSAPSAGLLLGTDNTVVLSVLDNDSVVVAPTLPFYKIGVITTNDASGVADSNNVRCYTSGVVYGNNFRKFGLGFYINDHTGGIYPFSSSKTYGYVPTEGDSVVVLGRVSQYFGFTEFLLDSVIKISSGNGLLAPIVLTAKPTETHESSLVRVNGLTYTSGWSNSGSGFTVRASKGASTYFIRIDSLTSAYGTPAPTSPFDVIGLVSQYDTGAPFDFGYDINVRYAADIIRTTGINDANDNVLAAVYPNPNNGEFTILLNTEANDAVVKLYDVLGNLVADEKRLVLNNAITFKTSLNNGFYYGVVETLNSRQKFKIELIK
ncbi:MAG: lamin tail domain-containing protein [Chitinophagales bacterium]|nr:lamin tail domain-containing protein [Chitinophagales bacterium]